MTQCQNQNQCRREMVVKKENPSCCGVKKTQCEPPQKTVLPSCGRNTTCCTFSPIAPTPLQVKVDSCGRVSGCCPIEKCCSPVYSCSVPNKAPIIDRPPQRCNPCNPPVCISTCCAPAPSVPARCAPASCTPARCAPASCAPARCAPASCAPASCAPTYCTTNPCPCMKPNCPNENFCTLVNNECGNYGLTQYAREFVAETGKIIKNCLCIKFNGLQDTCKHDECCSANGCWDCPFPSCPPARKWKQNILCKSLKNRVEC